MATPCSIPAWEISRTEEPGVLQYMGSQRAGHDRMTQHTFMHLKDGQNGAFDLEKENGKEYRSANFINT